MKYEKCLVELYEVLNYLTQEDLDKIPESILKMIEQKKDKDYVWIYDETKKLDIVQSTCQKQKEKLEFPNLIQTGECFLCYNKDLIELNVPNLKETGRCFLMNNIKLKKLNSPNLTQIGVYFFDENPKMKEQVLNILERKITPADIANLDKNNKITTTEVNWGKRVIDKLKDFFEMSQNR